MSSHPEFIISSQGGVVDVIYLGLNKDSDAVAGSILAKVERYRL